MEVLPLSLPSAGFSVIPSSLPSVVGRLGGRLTFPKWRVKLQCTCACKTPALGGIVIVSLPKYVSWRPLSRPKLTVLRAKPPLHAMAILRAHQAKGTKMHEGSTNLRLTQATALGDWPCPTGDGSHSAVPQEGDVHACGPRAPSMTQPCWEERCRQSALSWCSHLPGWTVRRTLVEDCAQKFSAVQKQTEAIQHVLPRRDAPFATALWQG